MPHAFHFGRHVCGAAQDYQNIVSYSTWNVLWGVIMQNGHVYTVEDLVAVQLEEALWSGYTLVADASLHVTDEQPQEVIAQVQDEGELPLPICSTSDKWMMLCTTCW